MDNSSNLDENYDLGYQSSLSSIEQNDQSTIETPVCSTISGGSFGYSRTYSEASGISEPTDYISSFGEPSPSCWPVLKSGAHNQPILTRLGMKQPKIDSPDDQIADLEVLNLGQFPVMLASSFEIM